MARPMSARSTVIAKRSAAIAAIDFGTTCTGYAYLLRQEGGGNINLDKIKSDQQWIGGAEIGLQAPTTVLMNPGEKFDSFGFEAESKYKTLTLDNDHKNWFYFRHFKMKLHHEQDLSRDMMLSDASGKQMKAMTIFSAAIKYVKDHLLKKLRDMEIGSGDMFWVITVPAIWRESAKQFMRESASKAGIPDEQLSLALEPESAAIFCKEVALKKVGGIDGAFLRAFDPGQMYIVVDCGGGTVDTTGHVVQKDGTLKELHSATGGPWGGELVNEAFELFVEKMVTRDVLQQFKMECTRDWINFERNFERKKREYSTKRNNVDLDFPIDLQDKFKEVTKGDLQARLQQERFKEKVRLVKHCLILKPCVMDELFANATDEINGHIDTLLKTKELKNVSTLLLVGGFSESPIVSAAVRNRFAKLRVIAPDSGGTAILKGAVMFGSDPNVISARICPFTYGVHTRAVYNKSRHGKAKPITSRGRQVVDNVFDKHLQVAQLVYVDGKNKERRYNVSNKANREVYWDVYQSTKEDPVFCDEENKCRFIGRLSLTLPRNIKEETVSLTLSMTCRGSELEAKAAAPKYKVEYAPRFDFLDVETGSDVDTEVVE